MKLNNNGWGTKEMILFSSIILLCLIITAILVSNLFKNIKTPITSNNGPIEINVSEYEKRELQLETAARSYIVDNFDGYFVEMKITINELKEFGYIEDILDTITNEVCEGYVISKNVENEELSVKPYIRCSNYTTIGY